MPGDVERRPERGHAREDERREEEACARLAPAGARVQHDHDEQRDPQVRAALGDVAGEARRERGEPAPARELEPGREDEVQQVGGKARRRVD